MSIHGLKNPSEILRKNTNPNLNNFFQTAKLEKRKYLLVFWRSNFRLLNFSVIFPVDQESFFNNADITEMKLEQPVIN